MSCKRVTSESSKYQQATHKFKYKMVDNKVVCDFYVANSYV